MTETVVHVTTLEQWKSVLDVWFKAGYDWAYINKGYMEELFYDGSRQLGLNIHGEDEISFWSFNGYTGGNLIEYSEFMAQQKDDNKMAMVYEVSQSVFDELQRIKTHEGMSLIAAIIFSAQLIKTIEVGNKAILRYLADDPAIEFKVKEPLYRLWLIDDFGNKLFFWIDDGRPDWVGAEDEAFTATLDEIKKWQTPAWEIEKAD
ncbi:hypothetical protein [Leuconostoc falkenbergense]|uniref:hypothetical protein n=1 Tax=Leuconostoc falkenbergense TaxID=2766470 RepID=UPI00293D0D82|nr:hypothetical protein [Leuconostoc falkenbergense]MDV3544883.1 hypothetical protein [Leuconostoc falkenbergense]